MLKILFKILMQSSRLVKLVPGSKQSRQA